MLMFGDAMSIFARSTCAPSGNTPARIRRNRSRLSSTDRSRYGLFRPGEHGSTFGGNPLACAIALAVLELLADGTLERDAAVLGARFRDSVRGASHPGVAAIRQRGLWAGVDLHEGTATARRVCERLLAAGVLANETHDRTIRFAPPLTTRSDELEWLLERVNGVLAEL